MSLNRQTIVCIYCLMCCGVLVQIAEARNRPNGILAWLGSILRPTTTTTMRPGMEITSAQAETSTMPSYLMERECSHCRCGFINTLHRIVGGQETRRHQYPWMAVILILERFYCAGSLINDLYVLTAAHCVEGVPHELISIRLLEHNRSDSDADVLQRQVNQVKTHELYNPRSFENDIAVIRLDRPVSFEGHVRPICLSAPSSSFEGELGIVTGWGAKREGDFATDALQEVEVLVLSQDECRNSSYRPTQIKENMICAGYLGEGGKDACSGDSGGPLHVLLDEKPGQYQLAGIVSWGTGCARPDAPGVYTRVSEYLRWIATNTPHACLCTPYADEDEF